MKTILIGFTRRIGSFTSDKTGELIEYSHRDLRFITDSGANSDNIGFAQFTAEKMKLGQLASILKVKEDDVSVDNALNALLSKNVNLQFAPVGDQMKLVWFSKADD